MLPRSLSRPSANADKIVSANTAGTKPAVVISAANAAMLARVARVERNSNSGAGSARMKAGTAISAPRTRWTHKCTTGPSRTSLKPHNSPRSGTRSSGGAAAFYFCVVKIEAVVGDITKADTEAIVNAANSQLWMGGGVAGVVSGQK